MNRAEYDALQAINWSRLKLIGKSPAHFKFGHSEDSGSFKLGTAAHMAILEPAKFAEEYVVFEGKVRRGKAWDEFEHDMTRAGKSILNQKEYDNTIALRDAILKNPKAAAYLQGGEAEASMVWKLGEFTCKGRADYIGPNALVDIKSTQCASPKDFAWSAVKYGYAGQAAWYSDGHALSRGKRLPFVIIAVESSAPYITQVYKIPDSVIEQGREQYLTLLGKLDYCTKNNFWGGYSEQEEIDLELPVEVLNVG
jgi:hypothetical protein